MYKEKYLKAAVLLCSIVLTVGLFVGTTAAFLITADEPVINTFLPSKVSCQVEEDPFDGIEKTNVTIKNTGDTTAYIRAAIVITWKDAEGGNVYAGTPDKEDYNLQMNETDWFPGSDGFYYFSKPVKSGESTTALIESCTVVEENTPAGYGLNVEILGTAIQSLPKEAVENKWGVTVNDDGTLSQ